MLEFFLIGLMVYYAPFPWLVIWAHISTLKKKNVKKALYFTLPLTWLCLGIIAYNYQQIFLDYTFAPNKTLMFLGISILILATIIEILSRKELGSKRMMGSSELNQTKDVLITTGIYKYARHPRHIEHPMWFLGLGLLFTNWGFLIFSLYLLLGFVIASYFEEQELIERYGNEYREYQRKTPAFFISLR